jgi:glutamate--cysteine ligase
MARDTIDDKTITDRGQLVAWFEAGCKPAGTWRLGTEHEKFPFRPADRGPVGYDGPKGIRVLLERLAERTGWTPIMDRDAIIGLADDVDGGAVSLEPGGQFELSGAPVEDVHATAAEFDRHMADVHAAAEGLDIAFLALGTSPVWSRAETPVMPKSRYRIMSDYMPKVGGRGLDMMYRTATVQVNLDYASEADMVAKLRASLALQPLATALFAASPFLDATTTGALSTRSDIWRDTDADRTGMLPFAFESGFGFERYVDWALDVPMYFVKRGDTYHDVTGTTFRRFLDGGLARELPGVVPAIGDWANHLGTLFPEARLKRYIEQRGADAGPRDMMLALPAFWVGLLYEPGILDQVGQMMRSWSVDDLVRLRADVPRGGLKARLGRRPLAEIARDAVALAREGLARRARFAPLRDPGGAVVPGAVDRAAGDERRYLEPIEAIAAGAPTVAERLVAAWTTERERLFPDLFETFKL